MPPSIVDRHCLFRCGVTCDKLVVLHHPACAYDMNCDPVSVQTQAHLSNGLSLQLTYAATRSWVTLKT